MLQSLAIRDFVLIDGLTLELGEGLNVLSGETGAGKSILVDALMLVLGGRARPEVVRTGRDAAEVEALFDVRCARSVRAALEEAGLSGEDGELVVRRVVGANGRSKAFVNGRLVTAAQLASITRGLVDVSSQHESQTLCDGGTHGALLDTYAKLDDDRALLATDVQAALDATRAIAEAKARGDALRAREDFLRFQLQEIDDLDVRPGEERELESARARLRHADRLSQSTQRAAQRLDDGEDTLVDALRRVGADVSHAAELDPSLAPYVKSIESAVAELGEVARALGKYAEGVEADPSRLAQLEERHYKLQKLLRKHGPSSEELLAHRHVIAAELASLDGLDTSIGELEAARARLLESAAARAISLSSRRKKAAKSLGDAIAQELATLGMGRAKILVDVAPLDAPADEEALAVTVETKGAEATRVRLTRTGIDRVELLIAPNPGEDPRPLRRIASGGELSRALLAVKRVLATSGEAGLYVFDEVDAGVGGAIAEAIGRKIADVARHHQVLCITHLPPIAAFADVHFSVSKQEEAGRTVTAVKRLDAKARVEEVARMLGPVTTTTKRAAEEMIRSSSRKGDKPEKRAQA